MKRWTVYCHTHIDGRRYVGITSQTWEKRWKNHISAAKSSKGGRWHFPNAIRKYGPAAFSHEVLGVYDSLEEANRIEKEKIEKWDLRNPLKGFNLAKGGQYRPHPIWKSPWNDPEYRAKQLPRLIAAGQTPEARSNNKAALNTPESKEKRSDISRQVHKQPDTRKKVQAALLDAHARGVYSENWRLGISSRLRGTKHDPAIAIKISAKLKGRKLSPEHVAKMKGRKFSEAQKQQMSAKLKGRPNEKSKRFRIDESGNIEKMCRKHGLVRQGQCKVIRKNGTVSVFCRLCIHETARARRLLASRQ